MKLASITSDFIKKVNNITHKIEWVSPSFKSGKKYLTVKSIVDQNDAEDPGYFYVERVGTDSVAILLYDKSRADRPWLCLCQFHSPIDTLVTGAFTGSLDKDISPKEIAKEEVLEEAGFEIPLERLTQIGYESVSANTNERVHLFIADITDIPNIGIHPENIFEQNTRMFWMSSDEVLDKAEWKAKLIVMKFIMAEAKFNLANDIDVGD